MRISLKDRRYNKGGGGSANTILKGEKEVNNITCKIQLVSCRRMEKELDVPNRNTSIVGYFLLQ